ncbi:MAG: DUF2147 domain-containing protein [Bacteroidota bacterium]
MKSWLMILSLGLITPQTFAQNTSPNIEGQWRDNVKGATILIYQHNGKYFGKLVAADDPEKHAKIQKQTILVLEDFEYEEDNEYCCGTVYQPEEDRRLSGTMELIDANTLEITGHWGFLSASREWTRVRT